MNIALAIEKLLPSAEYGGSLTDNTRESYEALRWEDKRPKPSWSEIVAADEALKTSDNRPPQEKIREEFLKMPLEVRDKYYDLMVKGAFALERGDVEYVDYLVEKAEVVVDKANPVEVVLLQKIKQFLGA